MAEKIVKFGDEAVEEIAGLKRIQQTLFPNGIEFSPSEFVEYIQTKSPDELTVKDAVLSKLYASGMKVVPDMGVMRDPSTKEFAKQFSDVFSKKRIGTAQQIIGFDKDLTKLLENVNLDDRIDDVKSKIPKYSPLETAIKKIQSGKLPKGVQGTKLLNATVLRDRGNDIVQALAQGLADMPNGVTKDAILVGMMGSRFVDIQGFRQTAEQAKEASQERPYFDYETGTQVNLDREGRKQLGPSKKLPSVTAQILKNRYDNAGETGELFKGVTRSSINKDLKKYVFSQIPEDINLGRDIKDLTYTDLRRIVGNFVANSLGDPKAADEIISHEGNLDTLDTKISSVFEKYYAKIENPNSELARTKGLLLYEKELAKGLGATDPMDFANKLGLGPNLETGVSYLPEFTAPEYPEVDVKIDRTGNVQKTEEIVLTPKQKQARAFEDTETKLLKGEEARSKRINLQEENLEKLSKIPEKKIVEGAEKEALFEQTKTDTKTKLRTVQREQKKKNNKIDAIEKNKKASKDAGDFFNDLFGPKVTKMESMMDTSDVTIGPTGEAVIEDKGLNINIPNLSGLPPVIKAGTALLQGQEADKEVAAGFLGDVVKDSLIETGVAIGTKALGAGKTLAAGLGGAATFLIDPNFPGQGKMGDQTMFGEKFERLSPEQRQELGLKDSFLTTN